jgi:uncharacterized membrane protein
MGLMLGKEVKSAGMLGLVGIVLMLIGLTPYTSVLNIAGLILVLIALYKLSRAYGNEAIWRNALYSVVAGIVGVGVIAIAVIAYLMSMFMHAPLMNPVPISNGYLGFVIGVIAAYVLIVIEYYFLRGAYRELARLSGVEDFNKAAWWYWRGALLLIVLVGAIFIIIGHVYALLGYNRLR